MSTSMAHNYFNEESTKRNNQRKADLLDQDILSENYDKLADEMEGK